MFGGSFLSFSVVFFFFFFFFFDGFKKNPFVIMDPIEGSGEGVWETGKGKEEQDGFVGGDGAGGEKKKSKTKNPFEIDSDPEETIGKGAGGRRKGDGNEKLPVTYPVRKGLDTFEV